MHGDGYNNIYQGDSLINKKLNNNFYNLVLTNPPFTIPYNYSSVEEYDVIKKLISTELDILFVERCINAIDSKKGGEIYIILPEGLLNLPSYLKFREWLLEKCFLTMVVSLPEGAFIPFGKSVSKTTILGLRKKNQTCNNKPEYVFLANAKEIGYEVGKNDYKIKEKNDLPIFLTESKSYFKNIRVTENGGEYSWIKQEDITTYRIDSNYLLNTIDLENLRQKFPNLIRLDKVCKFIHQNYVPKENLYYNYLEIPDVSPQTGVVSNIRYLKGSDIGDSFYMAHGGDLAYCRINPRKNRVFILPETLKDVLVSKEAYILELLKNSEIKSKFVLLAILQSDYVKSQLVRLSTGSSSSRARVQENDFLKAVFIPVPDDKTQNEIDKKVKRIYKNYWDVSQKFLREYVSIQKNLMSHIDINELSSI